MPRVDGLTVDELLAPLHPRLRDAAEEFRALVRRVIPDAIERVRPGWRIIGYDVPFGRRNAYFAFVWGEPEHVHLGFEYGAFMDDPDRVLGGSDLRQVRFVTVTGPGQIPEPILEKLLLDAARLARMPRAERFGLLLDREAEPVAEPS